MRPSSYCESGGARTRRTRGSELRAARGEQTWADNGRPRMHEDLMDAALDQARVARDAGEVPIGAVVSIDGEIGGRGFNQPLASGDPTAHAEIAASRPASRRARTDRPTAAAVAVPSAPCRP